MIGEKVYCIKAGCIYTKCPRHQDVMRKRPDAKDRIFKVRDCSNERICKLKKAKKNF